MTRPAVYRHDPKLDLVLERVVDVPREKVWAAWTRPEHLKQWFCPAPWKVTECDIDLRPGGVFRFAMQGPDGERAEYVNCYLEVVPNERLVWTQALGPGYRPQRGDSEVPVFTAIISMEPEGKGTRYSAIAMHLDPAGAKKHAEMGFHEGWGTVLDQLVALVKQQM
jgi:uncharacterized protein YndB with AHSA1/START domain